MQQVPKREQGMFGHHSSYGSSYTLHTPQAFQKRFEGEPRVFHPSKAGPSFEPTHQYTACKSHLAIGQLARAPPAICTFLLAMT